MLTLAVSLVSLTTLVPTTAPGDIADPRPTSQVVDLTGTLRDDQVRAIDDDARRGREGGELMVVVVRSTDGMNPRQWTTAVFNRLGLDGRARDRGVVLMAAIGDRKAEIVVGDGFPDAVTRTTDDIMANVVVAHFKAGDPQGALTQGARAIVDRVLLTDAAPAAVGRVTSAELEDPGGPAGAAAQRPPTPDELAASNDPVVLSVPDPRGRHGVVDGARLFSKRDLGELQAARAATPGLEVLVVTAVDTGGMSASLFARGLLLRLLRESAADRLALVAVVAPRPAKEGAPTTSVAALALGPEYPRDVADGKAAQVSAAWAGAVAQQATARATATAQAVRSLSTLDEELTQWRAQQARFADEARRARQAEARRQAEQQAAAIAVEPERRRSPSPFPNLGAWGYGVAGLSFCGLLLALREAVRRWPRTCKRCQVRMERLGEEVDDRHLSEGERVEERVGSVDYDVWSCPQCGQLKKLRWGALISSYSTCSGCSFRTLSSSTRTLRAATEYSTGLAEVTETCVNCGFNRVFTRTIPRRPKPSSSRSSSSSSGRSSRGSSSGRGSSGSW